MSTWAAATHTIQNRTYIAPFKKPAAKFKQDQDRWWRKSEGVFMKVTIVGWGGWLGFTPYYTIRLPNRSGTIVSFVKEGELVSDHRSLSEWEGASNNCSRYATVAKHDISDCKHHVRYAPAKSIATSVQVTGP